MSEVKDVEVEKLRKVLRKYQEDVWQTNEDVDKRKLGKVLTIIDGAIADETQRKAVKDLIHGVWHKPVESFGHIYPNANHVAEALGFELYNDSVPVESLVTYNPYRELAK